MALSTKRVDELARRALDTAFASIGLLILSPLLILVALAIRLTSPGPVLFKQVRMGKNGQPFNILKFRTMRVDAEQVGGQLTVGNDARITPIGRYLRAWKLDELPQLWNVVRGDMALVGPRPEVPKYVALYTPVQRQVLNVRPGITDPASVAFRSESEIMEGQSDPERYYVDTIMQEKLRINLEYLGRRSLLTDFRVIFRTFRAILAPGVSK